MPDFQKVTPGQPLSIPAAAYNAMIDLLAKGGGAAPALPPSPLSGTTGRAEILIKNNAGVDVPRFGILGISGVLIERGSNADEFYNEPVLTGVKPDTDDHADKYVVAQEPIPVGGIGSAVITGTTVVQVDMQSADDTLGGVADQDCTKLKSGSGTARVLYVESGTGTKWGVVQLGAALPTRLGKTDAEIAASDGTTPGSGDVSLYRLGASGDLEDTGDDVTAYNLFTATVPAGTWVTLHYASRRWWVNATLADGKVKVDADDELDYLEDQFKDSGTKAAEDIGVMVEKVADGDDDKLQLFVDADDVNVGKVKVDSGDDPAFLESQCKDIGTKAGSDVTVKAENVDDGGDEKMQLFVDLDDIGSAITIVTDVYMDGADLKKKTRTARIISPSSESAATIIQGTLC